MRKKEYFYHVAYYATTKNGAQGFGAAQMLRLNKIETIADITELRRILEDANEYERDSLIIINIIPLKGK